MTTVKETAPRRSRTRTAKPAGESEQTVAPPSRTRKPRTTTQPAGKVVALDVVAAQPAADRPRRERPAASGPTSVLNLQTTELIASPFRSFRDIGLFQQTLTTLAGVHAVQPRRLQQGALQLRVECRNTSAMLSALAAEYPLPFYLVSQQPHQVEITFDDMSLHEVPLVPGDMERRGA